ncbi:hypothetical protein FTUN_1708 [Frigoriglobus tundricola]|uniref:Uncharacterized protein n=1 Tax=Frigoriglobus tundricola TaxID=2774151 RepID=A0A6M5YJD5_9BACT|nr:hypothetical protein FTUN_1708 [Frigoriglobus tundricola]
MIDPELMFKISVWSSLTGAVALIFLTPPTIFCNYVRFRRLLDGIREREHTRVIAQLDKEIELQRMKTLTPAKREHDSTAPVS